MRRQRAGALVIKDKKLLLVTDGHSGFYWTPGGRLEEGENHLECLHRELDEELGVKAKKVKFYRDMKHEVVDARYFLVELDGELKPNNEIKNIHWYSREDFEKGTIKVSPHISDQIFPALLEDGLV